MKSTKCLFSCIHRTRYRCGLNVSRETIVYIMKRCESCLSDCFAQNDRTRFPFLTKINCTIFSTTKVTVITTFLHLHGVTIVTCSYRKVKFKKSAFVHFLTFQNVLILLKKLILNANNLNLNKDIRKCLKYVDKVTSIKSFWKAYENFSDISKLIMKRLI